MLDQELIEKSPIKSYAAAVSVGIVNNEIMLDLCYEEDSLATVDMNLVMNEKYELIEIQGTGEISPFTLKDLDILVKMGQTGIRQIIDCQKEALGNLNCLVGQEV
jgi:ribonuclease PH